MTPEQFLKRITLDEEYLQDPFLAFLQQTSPSGKSNSSRRPSRSTNPSENGEKPHFKVFVGVFLVPEESMSLISARTENVSKVGSSQLLELTVHPAMDPCHMLKRKTISSEKPMSLF